MRKKRFYCILAAISATVTLCGCHTVDDDRIPSSPIRIAFQTQSQWEIYGVNGALETRRFIKSEREPSNFPYTSLTYTGFGGVLLAGDIHGNPVGYDLACPVEQSPTVRIVVDTKANNAYCPKCGSVYDIFTNYGHPISGKAAQEGYGLQRYVVTGGMQGEYMTISR